MTRDGDGAEFAGPVVTRRGRPSVVMLAFLVAVGSLVAIGFAGRRGDVSPTSEPVAAAASASAAPTAESPVAATPATSPDSAPVVTARTDDMELTVRRHPETMFVHGDVLIDDVTWVFVSLRDARGRIAGWTSVSVPGGVNPASGDGPTLRFDVELVVPPEDFGGPLWVQVNAYNTSGAMASAEVAVGEDGAPLDRPGTAVQTAPAASLIGVDVEPYGRHLFVNGEVMTDRVIVVVVSLRDRHGRTLAIRSVNIPGGSTAFRLGAVNRFDVRFDRPSADDAEGASILVQGYDRVGDVVERAEVDVPATAD